MDETIARGLDGEAIPFKARVSLSRPVQSEPFRWVILILLTLGVMISFVDRTSISTALALPAFKQNFGLTDVDRGWVSSAFFWSYAVLQVPLGWVVDRYGVKWPYALCFACWSAATAGLGFANGYAGLVAMRLLVGAAEAVVVPASWRWIRDNFAEHESGTAVGVFMFGTKIGPAIGALIAAWLIAYGGWRFMFAALGLAGALWLVPWTTLVDAKKHPRRSSKDSHTGASLTAGQLLASPLIWATMLVNFCYNYFAFYCMTWMPAYLVEQRGLSLASMGLYSFFSFAGIAVVALAGGWTADRLIRGGRDPVTVRKSFTIAGFACASTIALSAHATTLDSALFWNVASLSGLGLATANYNALCRVTLIPASSAGTITGIQQVATAVAGIIAPIATGWLLHWRGSYDAPIDAIFLLLVLGALTTAFLLRRDWSAELKEQSSRCLQSG